MMRVSWCITTSVDGELKTIFPGAIDPADLGVIEPLVRRAVERRLKVEAAIRSGVPAAEAPAAAEHVEQPRVPRRLEPVLPTMIQGEMAKAQGYSGECCTTCGNFALKQAGHCLVCEACGTTTGCS